MVEGLFQEKFEKPPVEVDISIENYIKVNVCYQRSRLMQ